MNNLIRLCGGTFSELREGMGQQTLKKLQMLSFVAVNDNHSD